MVSFTRSLFSFFLYFLFTSFPPLSFFFFFSLFIFLPSFLSSCCLSFSPSPPFYVSPCFGTPKVFSMSVLALELLRSFPSPASLPSKEGSRQLLAE